MKEKSGTIKEYLEQLPDGRRKALTKLHRVFKNIYLPDLKKSWDMAGQI